MRLDTMNSFSEPSKFLEEIVSELMWNKSLEANGVIVRYYKGLQKAVELVTSNIIGPLNASEFEPNWMLPVLTDKWIEFFSSAQLRLTSLPNYKNRRLNLLDLHLDPATHTAKTLASLVIIARAIEHIRTTGEHVIIVVTTSGNKGVALRCAVERAIEMQLVGPHQLRIAIILPYDSRSKLHHSLLSANKSLTRLNPIFVYQGTSPEIVKKIGKEFVKLFSKEFYNNYNTRLWYSLNLTNYRIPDSVRAFFEYECYTKINTTKDLSGTRIHAHAVSSGYGFLGYHLGRSVLANSGLISWQDNPGYFLVQHLKTPDMVLHYYHNTFERTSIPDYKLDESTGLWTQSNDPHFPFITYSPNEVLEPTFYSSSPATAIELSDMIANFGGGGIVVSLYECLNKYAQIRQMLKYTDIQLPADPRKVQEWALNMVMTGVINAIDRNLIPEDSEITIHGSGFWSADEYELISTSNLFLINDSTPLKYIRDQLLGA